MVTHLKSSHLTAVRCTRPVTPFGISELRFCSQWAFKHAPLLRVSLCVSWAFLFALNTNQPLMQNNNKVEKFDSSSIQVLTCIHCAPYKLLLLRAKAATAFSASYQSQCCPSVCHMGGSVKNGAS